MTKDEALAIADDQDGVSSMEAIGALKLLAARVRELEGRTCQTCEESETMTDKTTTAIPVKQIVTNYLRMHGYDGLTDCEECGCFLGNLAPCECFDPECVPGYAAKDENGDDIIQPEKPQ